MWTSDCSHLHSNSGFLFFIFYELQRSLRDIARLYGCEATLSGVETHRKSSGLHSICSKCFEAAKISAIFFDDGFELDKMHAVEWHSCFAPAVGRILRIERLAEQILDEVWSFCWFFPGVLLVLS